MSTFLVLRYVAFALFISFSSVVCVIAAYNFGLLAPKTNGGLRQVDCYLIFLGALGIVIAFPVLFVEALRKNAFITRVLVEIIWVTILWIMHLSGAAAITAVVSQLSCAPDALQKPVVCTSAKVLVAFTWLCTATYLSYFFGLAISIIQHYHDDSSVWKSGVRDYPWFCPRETPISATLASYGMLRELKDTQTSLPTSLPNLYAQQLGLSGSYSAEPLRFNPEVVRPIPLPAPTLPPRVLLDNETRGSAPLLPVAGPSTSSSSPSTALSLYPSHLQSSVGNMPPLPDRPSGSTPPSAGSRIRSSSHERSRWKQEQRSPAAAAAFTTEPTVAQRGYQVTESGAVRQRPSGPRTSMTGSSSRRSRPPPVKLSVVTTLPDNQQR